VLYSIAGSLKTLVLNRIMTLLLLLQHRSEALRSFHSPFRFSAV
jgi:hypothetical protein